MKKPRKKPIGARAKAQASKKRPYKSPKARLVRRKAGKRTLVNARCGFQSNCDSPLNTGT